MRGGLFLNQQGIISGVDGPVLDLWGDIEAAWEFNGDTADSSGFWKDETGNHHITSDVNPTKQVGVVGDARGGIGSSQHMETGLFSWAAQDMTIMGWFNPHSGSGNGWGWFIKFGEDNNWATHHFRILKNEPLSVVYGVLMDTDDAGVVPAYPAASAGVWMHLTFTYVHATGTWAAYRNGVPTGDGLVGKHIDSSVGANYKFHFLYVTNSAYSGGIIDATRWFNRALTPEEAEAHYNGGAGLAYLDTP